MESGIGESHSVIQVIQLILAPAVMINACGLLLLATSNKYSMVLNRIRLINDEKRKLMKKAGEPTFEENLRLESVARQIEHLMVRARLVRNSVMCYTGAIALCYHDVAADRGKLLQRSASIKCSDHINVPRGDGECFCRSRVLLPRCEKRI